MEKTIYNGTIKVKFTDGNHAYYISKKRLNDWSDWERTTGCTTVIGIKDKSGPLKYWVAKVMARFLHDILDERDITKYDIDEAKKIHTQRLKEAGGVGTKIHDWCEAYVKNQNPVMPEEKNVLIGVNGFLDWLNGSKAKITESETIVYSKKHDFSGKIDAIATIKGKRYLIDYKTGTGLYNDVLLQTAAYAGAYEEMTGNKIHGRWAIRIEKRDEDEFRADMDEKGNPNADYVPFEAVYLDDDKEQMKEDYEAFLSFWHGFKWNKKTGDFFKKSQE